MKRYDFLIIGSGIAGLSFALKASKQGTVCIMTKAQRDETNTKYAQGGIAGVFNTSDSYEKHINDTMAAGDGLCNREIVNLVIKEGPARIKELIRWGANFDKNRKGDFDLAKEGGHSDKRILHFQDSTGAEIERALLAQIFKKKNIALLENYFAFELITQHHFGEKITKASNDIECFGVYAFEVNTATVEVFSAGSVILASGGAGQVYANTTNPLIATGDGIAMAYRAKAKVENMEFYQFHHTALFQPGVSPSFLITEALRGAGAVLKNHQGKEFMYSYHAHGSLAPRDIVARAMDSEMKKSGKSYLYIDARKVSPAQLKKHFPNVYIHCKNMGYDMKKDLVPVVPAAHYCCGGVKTDSLGRTSIHNLYACGECASTGLHGANRLASNSLLEALVFSYRILTHCLESRKIKKQLQNSAYSRKEIPQWDASRTTNPEELILIMQVRKEIQEMMSSYVGIVRSDIRMERAKKRLAMFYEETEALYKKTTIGVDLCETRNLISVGYLIIKSAMLRKESRGLHYNTDYPFKREPAEGTVF